MVSDGVSFSSTVRSFLGRHGPIGGVLALAGVLDLAGIGWGLPAQWAPDELTPADLLQGLAVHFVNGWHHFYPPLQFWILTALSWPVTATTETFDIGTSGYMTLQYIARGTSVAMGLGTLVFVYLIGRELTDRRGAALAALVLALSPTFIYYSKVANVDGPYLFWFVLSLWLFVRILARHRPLDYALFGTAAALAVCTKDQAYALYVFSPIALALSAGWKPRPDGQTVGLIRSLVSREIGLAIGAGALTFAVVYNLAFNFAGFLAHLRLLLGPGPSAYRMFPNTLDGHLQLALATVKSVAFTLGWPLFAVSLIGIGAALYSRSKNSKLLATAVFPVSYYVCFISIAMYQYDRFTLPMAVVLALFAGAWLSWFVRPAAVLRWVRVVLVIGLCGYGLLRGVTLDARIVGDARYCAAQWIEDHLEPGGYIVAVGLFTNFPWLPNHPMGLVQEADLDQLWRGEVVMTTSLYGVDRLRTPEAKARFEALTAGRTLHRLSAVCEPTRWPDLLETEGIATNLDKIDPEVRLYSRAP